MVLAGLVLVVSVPLCFFYLVVTLQRIRRVELRRK